MPDRYVTNGDVMIGINNGYVHAVCPVSAPSLGLSDYCTASCYYRLEIPSNNGNAISAGQFTYTWVMNASYTSTGTIIWAAGDTLASIRTQISIPQTSYGSTALTSDQQAIGISSGYPGANTVTITDAQGCTLIDMSQFDIFDENRTVRYADEYDPSKPVINNSHKSWAGWTPNSNLNTYLQNRGLPLLFTISNASNLYCYAENGQDYRSYCVINLGFAYTYYSASGYSSFRSDGANGASLSTSYLEVMRESVFNNNVNSSANPTTDQGKMYEYYSALRAGVGGYKGLHDKLLDKFGSALIDNDTLYMWYLAAHSADLDVQNGVIYYPTNCGIYDTHILGRVFTVSYNYKYVPAYYISYKVMRYEETTPIYQYIKNNVNNSQYTTGITSDDIGIYTAPSPWDISLIGNDINRLKINSRISDPWLGLASHTNITNNIRISSWLTYVSGGYHWTTNYLRRMYAGVKRGAYYPVRASLYFNMNP